MEYVLVCLGVLVLVVLTFGFTITVVRRPTSCPHCGKEIEE